MQTGTDPEKRSIGKGINMKLNWLKEIIGEGYTEEMDEKVCQAMGRDYVPRSEFNAKNDALKTAQDALKAYDGVDAASLRTQLDTQKTQYERQLYDLRLSGAINLALAESRVRNGKAARAMLDLDKVAFDDKGNLTGLTDQLDALKQSDGWLFDSGTVMNTGGEHGSGGTAAMDGVESAFYAMNPNMKH